MPWHAINELDNKNKLMDCQQIIVIVYGDPFLII